MLKKLFLCLLLIAFTLLWANEPTGEVNTNPEQEETGQKGLFPVKPFRQKKEGQHQLDPLTEKAMYPRLYIPDYNPVINNRIEVYKINKAMNYYKARPLEIPAFAPEYKEKIDFTNNKVILSVQVGDYKIAPDVIISFDRYFSNMQMKAFHKSIIANIKTQAQATQTVSSGLFKDLTLLPEIAMPKAMQKVLGSSAGRLNLDGTQKLTLQASNTRRKQVPIYDESGKNVFDLKMEMETNLRLSGTIGDKIAVNFKYNSKQDEQLFDMNNVNVKYTGYDDEFVQSIEGGNIALSLGGSRYVSYSASSQGLFGITSKFKYGNLDLNLIASKEESQKNTQTYVGKSQADSSTVSSWKYAKRTMYYLHDPYQLYQLKTGSNIPPGWVNNAIDTAPDGSWLVNENYLPVSGTVRLFYDDANYTNNTAAAKGDTIYYSNDVRPPYEPWYDELIEGTDFVTDYDSGIITVLKNIDRTATLGVQYTRRDGVQVPPPNPDTSILHVKVLRKKYQEYIPYNSNDELNTWHLQMRNIYDMGRTNIKNDGFELQVYTVNVDLTRNYNLPDNLVFGEISTYNDYLRLNANNSPDGIINGDDATVNLTNGWIIMPFIEPMQGLGDGIIYRKENEDEYSYQDSTSIFINIKGKIGREAIELSSMGVLKGSVRVRVNGVEQRENTDYIVDYDFGRITFLTAAGKDPDAKIEIDFESRTLFSVAQKNLAGIRANWQMNDYTKLGGTLIYRSESVADKRPRIGNENIEMIMGDIDGEVTIKPEFITRGLDALPLINTTAPSQISMSGEIAFTLPNIYGDPDSKKKEAYLDDMESIMDSYPLGVTYNNWILGSKPFGTSYAKGRINWFNPKDVKRRDIEAEATLTDQEKDEYVTVLTMIVKPNPVQIPNSTTHSWAGIMKYLGNQLDFSQKKYLEVYAKLEPINPNTNIYPNVTMHIDLGDINEDFYTEFGGYGVLNSEDVNRDGVLTISEDIGLDGISKNQPGHDPNDIAYPASGNDYSGVNGTEDNRILDTEDLDGNGVLNTLDRYISYSFSLSNPDTSIVIDSYNQWRMYRIPLSDEQYFQLVNSSGTNIQPSLQKVSYARIWLDTDCTMDIKVRIADISVVGNKWQDNYIRQFKYSSAPPPNSYVQYYNLMIDPTVLAAKNTSFISGIVSNQKNFSHYTSPPGTWYTEENRESAESALTLEVKHLQRDQMCLLRQKMLDTQNLLSYDKIRFWVYPEAAQGSYSHLDSLYVIFRIGADSLNYYQVRQRVPVHPYNNKISAKDWIQLEYNLQDLISLKEINPNADADSLVNIVPGDEGKIGKYYRGKPSLINIREIYLGVYVPGTHFYAAEEEIKEFSGTIYFDDIRVADPYEDIGIAKRLSLSGTFADVATLNIDYEEKSENFNTTIQRGRSNTFTSVRSLNVTNKIFVNRLLPNSWNMDIPISLNRNYSLGIPRFRANSDLLRANMADPELKEIEKTEHLAYSADFGLSQKQPPKSKILQYTIYRTSISGRIENSYNNTSTAIDTLLAYRGTLNYNLNLPADKTSLKLFNDYRLGYFPNTFSNSFTFSSNEPKSWDRVTTVDSLAWNKRSQTTDTRTITTDNNISWNILSDVTATARLNTKRDLKQKDYIYDINVGKQTEYVQDLGLNYSPNYLPRIFNFTSSASARYTDTQRKYTQYIGGSAVDTYQRDGNTNRSIRMNLTLMNSSLFTEWTTKMMSKMPEGTISPKVKDKDKYPKSEMSEEEIKKQEEHQKEEEIKKQEEHQKEEEIKKQEEHQKEEEIKKQEEHQKEEEIKKEELKPEEEQKLSEEEINKRQDEIARLKAEGKFDQLSEEEINELLADISAGKGKKETQENDGEKEPEANGPGFNPLLTFVSALSHIKNINASYQNTYVMNYARKTNPFPFAFQLGIPHCVPYDSLEAISNDNTLTIGSGITFSRRLDSVINCSVTSNRRYASASNQTIGYTFPDITLSLMDFESIVGLQKYITGSRLNTGFQYTVRQNGNLDWVKPKQESYTTALNPLLGFTGNLFKVVSTNLSYSISQTDNITDMDTYEILKTSNSQTLNGNLSYSFRAARGFSVPFTKKKIHIKNELTSSLGITYESNYDKTKGSSSSQVDRNTSRFSIIPQATYQFDANIRGGLTGRYEVNSDKKTEDGTSIFGLGIWVEVNL
ncbi:MAG: hypothetical protein M0P53_06535 [Candidatus Cloacimonas sp.]|nr:hypothetical protein [Candidatus Cloacimonas sp.]